MRFSAAQQEDEADGEALWGWMLTVKEKSREKVPDAIQQISRSSRERHPIAPGKEDDFVIEDQNQKIAEYTKHLLERSEAMKMNPIQ